MTSPTFTRRLLDFVERAGSERSTEKVLADMTRFIGETLDAHRVTVYLADGPRLVPYVSEFPSGEQRPDQFELWRSLGYLDESPVSERIRAGEEVILVERPDEFLPGDVAEAFGVQPLLLVALRTQTALVGVLVVEGRRDDLVARREDIREFAGFVALALENAQAFERENERVREAEALLEVARVLGESTEMNAVLASVARNTARVTGFERCSILLADDDGTLRPTMSQFADGHRDPEAWERFRSIEEDLPAARMVMASGRPAAYDRPESTAELVPSVWVEPFGIRSVLFVPLIAWDECFGVLLLDHRHRREISAQQMRMATGVAVHGAIAIAVTRLLARERESRRQAETVSAALRVREEQQATVAHLGRLALGCVDLSKLMDEAVKALAATLSVEYAKVLELLPDGDRLLLRAGVGWEDGLVGVATVDASGDSQAGFTLLCSTPVIVDDLATEERFSGPPLLRDHGIVSGISVVIPGTDRPYGVLGIHTTKRRTFTEDDVNFLSSVANVLAAAVERKAAEEAIRAGEARFQAILDTASDAIVSIDENQRIILFNQQAEEMFGYRADEVLGRPLGVLIPERFRERHIHLVDSFASRPATQRSRRDRPELWGLRRNGDEFPVEITISKLEAQGRGILTAIIRDITERKAAERRLEELIRSKDEFIASVSHELRTPLTGIVGFIELLRDPDQGLPAEERAQLIEIAAREAFDLSNIVEDLLVAARADIGTLQISRVSVDLSAQVAQVLEAWKHDVAVDVVSTAENVKAVGDPGRVRQIVRNLVSNAVRYGGSDIRIEYGTNGSSAWLRVSDDGDGVPDEDRERIFEPYQQIHRELGQPGSVGLGLSVARNLARLMGGDLTYDYRDGRSVFELTLPAFP